MRLKHLILSWDGLAESIIKADRDAARREGLAFRVDPLDRRDQGQNPNQPNRIQDGRLLAEHPFVLGLEFFFNSAK